MAQPNPRLIDPEIREVVRLINEIPGLRTFACCAGVGKTTSGRQHPPDDIGAYVGVCMVRQTRRARDGMAILKACSAQYRTYGRRKICFDMLPFEKVAVEGQPKEEFYRCTLPRSRRPAYIRRHWRQLETALKSYVEGTGE